MKIAGKITDFFGLHSEEPQIGDVISNSIYKLKIQHAKLNQVTVRLQERDKYLFRACALAVQNNARERAVIYATELAEVRKLQNLLSQTQIAIERIILRLETIKELSNIMIDLKPALGILKNVTQSLVQVMPDVASELNNINESISETLAVTSARSTEPPILPLNVKTPGGEEILNEVSAVLEEKLAEKFPEPPATITVQEKTLAQPVEGVKEMIALAACCSESGESTEERPSQTLFSYKELKSVQVTIQKTSSHEESVLEYLKNNPGYLDIMECASKLQIAPGDVEKALEKLGAEGKIEIKTS
ncbi:MAG: Snf7 family protein [Candidatus Bathyarchaeales archaeon]